MSNGIADNDPPEDEEFENEDESSENSKSNGDEQPENKVSKEDENLLELPKEFFEKPPSNADRMFKESKARIKAAVQNYAELGLWFSRVRRFGLWQRSKRPKYKSFAEFYRDMGYTADQVSHQIAISSVLRSLLAEFGKSEVKVTVYHATVLLSGVRDKEVRFQADGDLACEIFRSVLEENNKVTGKLLKAAMVARGLINASKAKDTKLNRGNSDLEGDEDQIGEAVDGMSLGEDADEMTGGQGEPEEKGSDATSGENHAAAAAQAAAVAQAVRRELVQARTIATDLIEEVERSLDNQKFRPRLIELRSLLDEIEKQLGS